MKCPLYADFDCPMEDIYGACFFCGHALSCDALPEIPVLETNIVYPEKEN